MDAFYGNPKSNTIKSNWDFVSANNKESLGIYFLPSIFNKYFNVYTSIIVNHAKIKQTFKYMQKGYYPDTLLPEVNQLNESYEVLSNMFKLD